MIWIGGQLGLPVSWPFDSVSVDHLILSEKIVWQLSNPSLLDGHLEWGPDPHSLHPLLPWKTPSICTGLSEKQKGTQSQLRSRFGMVRGVKNTFFFPSCPLLLVPVIAEGAKQSLLLMQSKLPPPTPSHMLMPWGPWMPRVPRMP